MRPPADPERHIDDSSPPDAKRDILDSGINTGSRGPEMPLSTERCGSHGFIYIFIYSLAEGQIGNILDQMAQNKINFFIIALEKE